MKSFIFAGFAIINLVSTARVDDPVDQNGLIDMTQDLLKMEALGSKAIRCCCDTRSSRAWVDNNPRSGRCQIFTQEKSFKCGSVTPRPEWLSHNGGLHHFDKCKDPRCLVPEDEAEQFYRTHGTADNYCSSFTADKTFVGAAALGKDSIVTCDAGYKPQVERVTCTWKSIQQGIFDPQPQCVRDEEWCHTVDIPQVLSVAATNLDASSPVTCAQGSEPVHKTSTCTTDRTFKPTPECKPISNYCVFQTHYMGPSVQPAAKNQLVPIQCPPGTSPPSEMTRCTEGGNFEPQPYCTKVWDFCKSIHTQAEPNELISPGPSVDAAALGNSEIVRCRIGWEAQPTEVKCTESGYFDQTPKCMKLWNWCSLYEEGDTYVRYAARDESQDVICSHKDFKPETDRVICQKNRKFKPTPKCIPK